MADAGSDGVAGDLTRRLADEAEYVGDGALAIDAERALAKLGRYQLSDPYHYVLRFAEAGIRLGAAGLWFWTGVDTLVAHIDGRDADLSLAPETLEHLLVVLVGEHHGEHHAREALVQLAVAVNAARVQLQPAQLWLDSVGPEGRGHRLMLEGERPRLIAIEGGTPGIWLRVQERPASLGARAAGLLFGARPEAKLLAERAVWASTPIALDNRRISHGFSLPGSAAIHGDEGQVIGVGAVARRDSAVPACVVLCVAGLEVERVHPPGGRPGFFALVEAPLARDLGYARFVRGEAFDALIERAMSVQANATKLAPARGTSQRLAKTRRGKLTLGLTAGFQIATMALWFYGLAVFSEGLAILGGMIAIMIAPVVLLLGALSSGNHAEIVGPGPQRLPADQRRAAQLAAPRAEPPALPPAS